MKKSFDGITEPNLKKTIKQQGGIEDIYNKQIFYKDQNINNTVSESDKITPEDICLYERMLMSKY